MKAGAGIELRQVSKRYETPAGVVGAVDGVSLDVHPGTSVAVMGPSGCGKSTLLGLIAGLDVPTTGSVALGGRAISELNEPARADMRRHELGLVFQSDNLLPFLTAHENVSLQLAMADTVDADERSIELLAALGLEEEADRYPDQLSGGQRQRVAVARAVIHRPTVIVADEPTGSLDPESAEAVVDLLLCAHRSSGATMVVVTHEPQVAARLDRTIGMRDGRLAETPGPIEASSSAPSSKPARG